MCYAVCFGQAIRFNKKHPHSCAESFFIVIETSCKRVFGESNVTVMLLLLNIIQTQITNSCEIIATLYKWNNLQNTI